MRTKNRSFSVAPSLISGLSVAALLLLGTGAASAAPLYEDDGAVQSATGGWDMPQSSAGLGIGTCAPDPTQLTRPDCEGLRLNAASSGACTGLGGSWTTGSVCNDNVNTNEAACEAAESRLWNAATNICAVTMKGYNRNEAVCLNLGGTWAAGSPGTCRGSWVFPASSSYDPPLLSATGSSSGGPGDQCLRCHNSITEWNSTRIRDVEKFLMTGHKNMGRKVTPGIPWAGPTGDEYVADSTGALFDWDHGTLGGDPVAWIYADWLTPLPRAVKNIPGQSYSCGRCHMTGWQNVSDSTMEPEASFPGIRANVNVTGSWDLYGITCSRCHGSAVENTDGTCSVANLFDPATCSAGGGTWTAGLPLPAAYGMNARHHSDLTGDAVSSGYCTNTKMGSATKLNCEHFGGTWFSACSDDRWYSAAQCVASSGCINPNNGHALNYANEGACEAATAGECSIPVFTTSAPCVAGGGTWTAAASDWWTTKSPSTWTSPSCSVGGGTCSVAGNLTPAACKTAFGIWTPKWSNVFACMDAGGHWTGNKSRRGQIITSMCMDCHRQETGGNPYDSANPAGNLKVGPAHGSVEFVSHPHANQYLNSPHGKFTGTFAQIGTATYGNGYGSYFQFLGEASGTGNGCTGCHNVHESIVEETGHEDAIHAKCDSCHSKNLNNILHPLGGGTPMEHMATEPEKACVTCHMPNGEHLFRVNTDPTYSTYPPTALTATVNANTSPDDGYASAVWVDVDAACGQCHGGGSAGQAFAIGSITSGSKALAVDSAVGFAAGERVVVGGAGALDNEDGVTRADLHTYIVSVVGNTLNLAGAASATVSGSTVEQNPTANGGAYINKLQLAALAENIHADEPQVSFGYTFGSPDTLTLNVDGSKSVCAGTCDAYDWAWGDGTPNGSGATASHTYAAAGTYSVTLTVEEHGVNSASKTRSIKLTAPDLRPTVGGTCTFDANTWTANVADASTDDVGIKQVTVNWGDGSVLSNDTTAPFGPFSRTYKNAGSYTVRHRAIDTIGQARSETCLATPTPFVISGTVYRSNGTTAVPSASVQVRQGGALRRTVYTASNGTFSVGNLKPGTYTLTLSKSGFTFGAPTSITVGPSSVGNVITATVP